MHVGAAERLQAREVLQKVGLLHERLVELEEVGVAVDEQHLTRAYPGQVLLVHGDTHFFKLDKPLMQQADLLENFTRLETFGSPNVHWVRVTVDPASRSVFSVHQMIVKGN